MRRQWKLTAHDGTAKKCSSWRCVWDSCGRLRGARDNATRAERWPSCDTATLVVGHWLGTFLQLASRTPGRCGCRCFCALASTESWQFSEVGRGDKQSGGCWCRSDNSGGSSDRVGTSAHEDHRDRRTRRGRACCSRDPDAEVTLLAEASVVGRPLAIVDRKLL